MCSISSRTNSPAWVVGALPCRRSRAARCSVRFSGMVLLFLLRSSMDHAAGQPLARVAGRIGLVVVYAFVNDQCGAVAVEQRIRSPVERHALDRYLQLHAA